MNTHAHHVPLTLSFTSPSAWVTELQRRQPTLAAVSRIFLIAALPCMLAAFIDTRTVNDISGWIKPTKFFVSLALYYATLAWFFGYLPEQAQRKAAGRFVIWASIVAGVLEMVWMVAAAMNGVPAHFNRADPAWFVAYRIAGVGALTLVLALLVQGVLIGRQRDIMLPAAFRLSLVLAAIIATVATLVVAGYMAKTNGHWIGAVPTDAGGLPLLGWSRNGGDLRVAHFWALHAHQLLPFTGWMIARSRMRAAQPLVWMAAFAYVGFIVFTFLQALRGEPFLI